MLQFFYAMLLSRGNMRPGSYATASSFGMAVFQQMRQLIPISGMNSDFQGMGALGSGLCRPAFGVLACADRGGRGYLLFHGIRRLLYGSLYSVRCRIRVIVQLPHDRVGKLIHTDFCTHQRLTFRQSNLIALFLQFM